VQFFFLEPHNGTKKKSLKCMQVFSLFIVFIHFLIIMKGGLRSRASAAPSTTLLPATILFVSLTCTLCCVCN
jgi:hypothetical protein